MKEEFVQAGCNLSAVIVIIGIALCTCANTRTGVIAAFAIIAVGILGGIIFAAVMETINPLPRKENVHPIWEKQDQEDLRNGKFDYIYNPEYPFLVYLFDNDTTLSEMINLIDADSHPKELFEQVYKNYCASAGHSRVQTLEQVQSMIWRERRRQG